MRALLHFILRGQVSCGLLLAAASAIPLLAPLAAAGGSLLLLRRGLAASGPALLLVLLPTLAWWQVADEPRMALILLGSFALAQVLRHYSSWVWVLLCSLLTGAASALCLKLAFSEPLAAQNAQLQQFLPQALGTLYQQMSEAEQLRLSELMPQLLLGVLATLLQIASLIGLMLARYWQALLFNPGGFAREFHALRLPKSVAFSLFALLLIMPALSAMGAVLMPLCSLPLLFAGIALVHGKLAGKAGRKFGLVGLYLSLLLFMQFAYPLLVVLALADSLFDFRGLKTRKGHSASNPDI